MSPESLHVQDIWRLKESVPGIEALITEGAPRIGRGRELPEGAELVICGSGFDENTVTVLWNGRYYFVYVQYLRDSNIAAEKRPS